MELQQVQAPLNWWVTVEQLAKTGLRPELVSLQFWYEQFSLCFVIAILTKFLLNRPSSSGFYQIIITPFMNRRLHKIFLICPKHTSNSSLKTIKYLNNARVQLSALTSKTMNKYLNVRTHKFYYNHFNPNSQDRTKLFFFTFYS